MDDLIAKLRAMRADLVGIMANEVAADREVHSWLPLLAQIQAAIRAVEAVMGESEAAGGHRRS